MASPLPTSSKLRKSCDLCAATKVGCTKEKPSCARCAKRDHPCVYSTAKRAGRTSGKTQPRARRDSGLPMTATGTATMTATASPSPTFTSEQASDTTRPSTPGGGGLSPSLDLQRQCSPYPDIFGALRSLDENCLSSLPANAFPDLDELFASAVGIPLDQQDHAATFFDFALDDTRTCPFPAPEPITLPTSPTSVVQPHVKAPPSISVPNSTACQCLARALALLADLSPGNPGCGNDPGATTPELPDFERVLAENEQKCETVRRILQCNCTNDSYLLITLSLVVFRVIAWYTAATGAASGEDPFEPVLQGPSPTDCACEDEQRIAVQRILSKLAGVQASVDLLSQRLRRISETAGEEQQHDSCDPSLHIPGPLAGGIHAFLKPFSPGLVNTLETDLRKRLCDLSRAIVDRLRR